MLDTLLIVDATMIVGVLFAEAVGRALGIRMAWNMGLYMLTWGIFAVLPFSASSIFAILGNEWVASVSAMVGFMGFTIWFFSICYVVSKSRWRTNKEQSQKVVDEESLEAWLRGGWEVVAVLKSGKIVVEHT
jgi:hypothetical protein